MIINEQKRICTWYTLTSSLQRTKKIYLISQYVNIIWFKFRANKKGDDQAENSAQIGLLVYTSM